MNAHLRTLPLLQHEDPAAALTQALSVLSMDVTAYLRDPADIGDVNALVQQLWLAATPLEAAAVIVCSALAIAGTPPDGDPWMTAVTTLTDFITDYDGQTT